jgi:broad specificity phosphatase PhoE
MHKRAKEVLDHLIKHHKDQNVICISHIAIMMLIVLQAILHDKLTPEVFWQFYYHARHSNTGITHLEHSENAGWYLVTWNDTEHL